MRFKFCMCHVVNHVIYSIEAGGRKGRETDNHVAYFSGGRVLNWTRVHSIVQCSDGRVGES